MIGLRIKKKVSKQTNKADLETPADKQAARQFAEGTVRLKDILAPAAFSVESKHLEIDGKFATTIFAIAYPRYLETNWLSPIINFDVEFDLGMFIYPQDSSSILRQLKSQITRVSASILMRTEKGKVRDPQLETAYRDIEELRDRLVQGTERFFQFSLYLTIYANTKEELDETAAQIEVMMEGRLVYIKPAIFQMREGFLSTLPLGQDKLIRTANMSSSPLSTTFPFVSSDLTSSSGVLYGINLHNNSLIIFDRFSLPNANMVIFAKSGAGKSIKGSEPVLVRQNGQVRLRPIKEVVEELLEKHGITYTDDELEGVAYPDIDVYSFNKKHKGEWSRVTVAARKTAPAEFYRFTTRSGREITTTGDHNMLVLRDGQVQALKGDEVKEGEYLPLPRVVAQSAEVTPSNINLLTALKEFSRGIYVKGADTLIEDNYTTLKTTTIDPELDRYLYKYRQGQAVPLHYCLKLLEVLHLKPDTINLSGVSVCSRNGKFTGGVAAELPLTPGLFRLLGYIVAEGTIGQNAVIISNTDHLLLRDAKSTLNYLNIPSYVTDRSLIIASRVFVNFLAAIKCQGKSRDKRVPPLVFASSKQLQAAWLSGYFEGDAGVERSSVVAVSKSKELIGEVCYLLYSFGIVGRLVKTRKKAVGEAWRRKRLYWKCTISGQDNLRQFATHIKFASPRKQKSLEQIANRKGNSNVDLVPEVSQIFSELYDLFGWQMHGIPQVSIWKNGVSLPSPKILKQVIKKIKNRVRRFNNLRIPFNLLETLPDLNQVITVGANDQKFNQQLWNKLGQSWRVAKTRRCATGCQNAFQMINVVRGDAYELSAVKQAIRQGCREAGVTLKYQPGHLQSALTARPQSNTAYHTIYHVAHTAWQRYQEIKNNTLPRVEELLNRLTLLAESDLFWDQIVEIKKINNRSDAYVYDLTVNNETFLAGYGGMFVHNSYAVKLEILRQLMFGTEVIVIDPEQEYRYLAESVDGAYLRVATASDHRINPFDLPELNEDDDPESVLRENIVRLTGLVALMAGEITPEEESVVDRALWETYAIKDITKGARWKTPQVPTLQDFYNIIGDMEGGSNVALRIERFVEGTYAGVFNRPTNIDLNKQLVVFNVRDMEEELRPLAMYVVLGFIWNKVRSVLKKRILVVDEAWVMMQHEESARFMFSVAKRARKYYLGVTTVTQDIQDFLDSSYGKPIVTNSSLQLLLRQSPASIDLLADVFYLTDHEKFRLLESDVGEGIFFAGLKHVAIKIIASYTEDQVITSDPQQVLAIEAAKRELAQKQDY